MRKLIIISSIGLFLMGCSNNTTTTNSNSANNSTTGQNNSTSANQKETRTNLPSIKKYLEMSDAERSQYIALKAQKTARMMGNSTNDEVPSLAVNQIKSFVDNYAKRVNTESRKDCFGGNLQAAFERASQNAPSIINAFNQEGVEPQIGIYLAMIESDHCQCVQSPTGSLGIFQFTYARAVTYFDKNASIVKDAKPPTGDDRCKPEVAARGAARYIKYLMSLYGTEPGGLPLTIASYNSGEEVIKNLKAAMGSDPGLRRDFWTLITNSDKMPKQFQDENLKYFKYFFAAAIIGENPEDFGLNFQPLSTYTK